MVYHLFRITPGREFSLNNRWEKDVKPKGHFFFIERDKEDLWKWVYFLCETKERSYLWVHYIIVDIIGRKDRLLTTYRKLALQEVMAPVETTKILLHTKSIKVTLSDARRFISKLNIVPIEEKERVKKKIRQKFWLRWSRKTRDPDPKMFKP